MKTAKSITITGITKITLLSMRKLIIIVFIASLLASCGSSRHAATSMETRDSTMVEVRTELVERIDTVYVELPRQVERVVTRDTSSRLENDYAVSEASIEAGFLYHSLETKITKIPLPVKNTQERRDCSSYMSKSEHKKEIEFVSVEKPLTAWQKFRLNGFWILVAIIVGYVAWKNKKKLLALILKL